MKCGQVKRVNIIVKHSSSYHYFSQPGTGNFAELSICFVVQNRPAVPNPKQTVHFIFFDSEPRALLYTNGNSWSCVILPVSFIKSCRVESLQQEMDHYVEGVLVWSVKHVPIGPKITLNIVRIKFNVESNVKNNLNVTPSRISHTYTVCYTDVRTDSRSQVDVFHVNVGFAGD